MNHDAPFFSGWVYSPTPSSILSFLNGAAFRPASTLRFLGTMLITALVVSCQSTKTPPTISRKVEVLYESAPNAAHLQPSDPPAPPSKKNKPPESVASRCVRPFARGLSAIGRIAALPAGVMLGAIGGNPEILKSTTDGVFKEPLP